MPSPEAVLTDHAAATVRTATVLLAASDAAARALPDGFHHTCVVELLMRLSLPDEKAQPRRLDDLPSASCSPEAVRRWVAALVSVGYVDRRGPLVALSAAGQRAVAEIADAAARAGDGMMPA